MFDQINKQKFDINGVRKKTDIVWGGSHKINPWTMELVLTQFEITTFLKNILFFLEYGS